MSAPGQIDPVMALAQQGAGISDPVEALAMGQHISAPPSSQSPPPPQQYKGWADPAGYLSSLVRNTANAASFNLADPAAAAIGAAVPVKGWTSTKPTYGERYAELLKLSRDATAEGQKANPLTSLTGSVMGGMLNPVTRAIPAAKTLPGAVGQGMAYGGAYGAGGAIGNSKDLSDALKQTATGAGYGGLVGGALHGVGRLLSPAIKTEAAQFLNDKGVPTTIGENLGGEAQRLEDASTSVPIFGEGIKNRQREGIAGFNRATYDHALEPLGVEYPQDQPVGNKAIQWVQKTIGKAYTQAFDGAKVQVSPDFKSILDNASADAGNVVPDSKVEMIQKNIDRLIHNKLTPNGELSGQPLQDAKEWFSEHSRTGSNASMEDQAMGDAYGKVYDAIKAGVAKSDPEKGALLKAADTAYMRFARIAQASSSNNASGRTGMFTPTQFGAALRSMDDSTRKLAFAQGTAPMQDLAQAGQEVLAPTVPDSGTPLRTIMEHPIMSALSSPVWLSGRALYSKTGQSLANALLFGAPQTRAALAKIPPTMLPGFVAALNSSGKPQ